MANEQNLVPLTTEKAREIGRLGGVASGEAKRRRKMLSEAYSELLADEYNVELDGKAKRISGYDLIKTIARDILMRRDSASVSMMKEIREATEGENVNVLADVVSHPSASDLTREEREVFIQAYRARKTKAGDDSAGD